jgi:hypothetical protein
LHRREGEGKAGTPKAKSAAFACGMLLVTCWALSFACGLSVKLIDSP